MDRTRGGARLLIVAFAALVVASVCAVENDPLPVSVDSPREAAVLAYNDGVQLLLARKFADAQRQFEQALRLEDTLAEAHNNLAFTCACRAPTTSNARCSTTTARPSASKAFIPL